MFVHIRNALILLLVTPFILAGQPAGTASSTGLDLVVIVDQSGSMMGVRSVASNDPEGVRNDMVRRILFLMVKNGVANRVTHRMGVVSFGDTVRVDIPLTEATPTNVDQLSARLAGSLTNTSLGNTDFLAAFQQAKKLFARKGGAAARRRVVMLITDGAPYVEGIKLAPYVKELRETIAEDFPAEDYLLHVIALNDPESDYWNRFRQFWRTVSHNHAKKLEGNRKDIFQALQRLISDLLGIAAEPVPETAFDNFVVPPYLESIVFDIFRIDPEQTVDIYPADTPQQKLTADSAGVEFSNIGKTIQTIKVENPAPGRWVLKKSIPEADVEVYAQKFFPRGQLIQPSQQDLIRQHEFIAVAYRVVGRDGKPIKELPGYPLKLELSLVKPDSSRISVEMARNDALDDGVFMTTREVECGQVGRYRTEILIATKDLTDRQVTVFRDQYSGFDVIPATRIDCAIARPKPFEEIPIYDSLIFDSKPVQLEFRFTQEDGQPLNLPAVFGEAVSELLDLSFSNDGQEQKVDVTFTYKDGGILTAESDAFSSTGEYKLKIRANRSVIPGHYTIRIDPPEISFSRYLKITHWLQGALSLLLLLVVAGGVGYAAYLSMRYPLRGSLYIDRIGGSQLREYILTSKRNWTTIEDLPPQTQITKLKVKARRDRRGGIVVTALGDHKTVYLENRTLVDRGQAMLRGVPYIIRYRG